jgi:plastocyanin
MPIRMFGSTARAVTTLLAAISLSAAIHAGEAAPMPATGTTVRIDNFSFTPAEITVDRGATLTWVNEDDIPHTVAATDKTFRSKAMDTDDSFSFKFTTPGAHAYFCALHPHMQGKVIVK